MNLVQRGDWLPGTCPGPLEMADDCMFSEFSCRVPSVHRRHGDPFPLPRLGQPTAAGLLSRRLDGAVGALNQLSGAFFDRTKAADISLTAVQKLMMEDLRRRVSNYGNKPSSLHDEQSLRELLQHANLYTQEANNVAKFDAKEIKILSRKLEPIPAAEVASPAVRKFLEHFESMVERPVQELEGISNDKPLVEPHWDIRLKSSRSTRMSLYKQLFDCGLLTFRWRQKAKVGIFAVKKKGNKPGNTQRLIVDCRQCNALLRRPPTTRLSTPVGLTSMDFSNTTMDEDGFDNTLDGFYHPNMETGDVGDCFYNFLVPQACSWFSTGDLIDRKEMRAWGIEETFVYNDSTKKVEPLPEDTPVYICFKGMPMGWSWALFLAQDIVCHQSLLAIGGSEDQLVRDKHPAPRPRPGVGAVGVYVDNVHTFGGDTGESKLYMQKISSRFEQLGIPFEVDDVSEENTIETLGLCFRFDNGVRVTAKAERAWRLWAATRAILRRRRVSGDVLRVWLGHVNFHFLMCRPLLSILNATYKFAIAHLGHRFPMWDSVRKEIKLVLNLIFVVEKDMSAEISHEVHVGDSSDLGYGLLVTDASPERIRKEMKVDERWRFIHSNEPWNVHLGFDGDDCAAGACEDPAAFQGSRGQSGVGTSTAYGVNLNQKWDTRRTPVCSVKQKRVLFDKAGAASDMSLISVPGFPEIDLAWSVEKQWNLVAAKPWKEVEEHINIKEAKVALMGLRRLCRNTKNFGRRCLSLCDNQVAVFAFSKGRSGANQINNLCRRAAAYQVGCNIRWHLRYIKSERNPADAPSRQFGPDIIKPGPRKSASDSLDAHISVDSFEQGYTRSRPSSSGSGFESQTKTCFLELFSGTGHLSKAVRKQIVRTLPDFEVAKGEHFNLLDPLVQNFVLGLIKGRHVWMVHLGTPCIAWSRARHGIKNLQKARLKEQQAVATALFSCRVIRECLNHGVKFSLENPFSSRLWQFSPLMEILKDKRVCLVHFDLCRYNEPHRKTTTLLTNEMELQKLGKRCCGGHKHVPLQGSVRVKQEGRWVSLNRTVLAGAYSSKLCDEWAQIISRICPDHGVGVLGWRERNEFLSALQETSHTNYRHTVADAHGHGQQGRGREERSNKCLQEAIRFLAKHPVVFGQFAKADNDRQEIHFAKFEQEGQSS